MWTRICSKCKQKKLINKFHKDSSHKLGHHYMCKECSKKYYQTKKGRLAKKATHLKTRYSLTLEQHKQMYVNQNGCCKICRQSVPYDKIDTDHDHKTGRTRGLLCRNCNIFVGHIERAPDLVSEILKYIRRVA